MRAFYVRFIAFLIFSLPVLAAFSEPGKNSRNDFENNENNGNKSSQMRNSPSLKAKKRTSGTAGSDRKLSLEIQESSQKRNSFSSSPKTSQPQIDVFNPETGWHIISEPSDVIKYRGTRKAIPEDLPEVAAVQAEKNWNGTFTIIEICFTEEINPRSFSSSNLKINGKTADNDVKFKFGRNGDSVKIQIPTQKEILSLSLDNVESFDGEKIPEIKLNDISVE